MRWLNPDDQKWLIFTRPLTFVKRKVEKTFERKPIIDLERFEKLLLPLILYFWKIFSKISRKKSAKDGQKERHELLSIK